MSSPTEDTEDIDQLVKEFSEKHEQGSTFRGVTEGNRIFFFGGGGGVGAVNFS